MKNKVTQLKTIEELSQEVTRLINKLDLAKQEPVVNIIDNDQFISLLKISKRTALNYRDQGLIGFSQIKGKIFYSPADIDDFIMRHRTKPKSENK